LETIEGIILKKIAYKESSEIIYLYTNKGLVSVLVHGSKKIKSPYLNLTRISNLVSLFVSGKDLLTLRDGETKTAFPKLGLDIEKYTYISHVFELIYYFSTHEHDHDKLYNFLLKIIQAVETTSDYIPYIYMLELKLLFLLGVNPNLNTCNTCGGNQNLVFSVIEGSVFCDKHSPTGSYGEPILKYIRILYYFDLSKDQLPEVGFEIIKEVRFLLDNYYEYHLNYRSKARKMLKELIGY
jgi:DNA repair protein RecO (recombination protein O)